jgi:hypothetical protein
LAVRLILRVVAIAIDDREGKKRLRQWEAGKPGWRASLACMIGVVFQHSGKRWYGWPRAGSTHGRCCVGRILWAS